MAIKILKYLNKNKDFYFPFRVICRERCLEGLNVAEIEPNEWKLIFKNKNYKTFELWENLQQLDEKTLRFMAKGFIEEISSSSLEKDVEMLAKKYRKEWKEELWESENIEEFGFNEFIGGKAEAFEDCLDMIRDYNKQYEK